MTWLQTFGRRGGWWVAGQGILLIAIVAVIGLTEIDLGLESAWRGSIRVVGAVSALAGAVLGLWGFMALGRNLTPYPEPLGGGSMVARGPYRYVRHPIYGGVVLGMLGLSLIDPNALAALLSLALLGYFWAKAVHEEKLLRRVYPDYDAYAVQVKRRLIPFVV